MSPLSVFFHSLNGSMTPVFASFSAFAAENPELALGLVAGGLIAVGLGLRWVLGRADEARQPDLEEEVFRFEAIRAYRQLYGVSLKEARRVIMKLPPKLLGIVVKKSSRADAVEASHSAQSPEGGQGEGSADSSRWGSGDSS